MLFKDVLTAEVTYLECSERFNVGWIMGNRKGSYYLYYTRIRLERLRKTAINTSHNSLCRGRFEYKLETLLYAGFTVDVVISKMNTSVIWDMTPCRLVDAYRRPRRIYHLRFQGKLLSVLLYCFTLNMEAVRSSET
jgi:hypothetical protein